MIEERAHLYILVFLSKEEFKMLNKTETLRDNHQKSSLDLKCVKLGFKNIFLQDLEMQIPVQCNQDPPLASSWDPTVWDWLKDEILEESHQAGMGVVTLRLHKDQVCSMSSKLKHGARRLKEAGTDQTATSIPANMENRKCLNHHTKNLLF